MVLFEMTPMLSLVNRQFSDRFAEAGTQVNAYRAAKATTQRKSSTGNYTVSDVTLTAVPVKLDQIFYKSFLLSDYDESRSISELRELHLVPQMKSLSEGINRAILGRVHAFLRQGTPSKRAGRLRQMTSSNAHSFVLEAEEVLTDNLAPMPADGLRTAIVHHTANTKLMESSEFSRADARQGAGTIMTGEVGVVYNTRVIVSQAVNYVKLTDCDVETKAINNAAGYAAGEAGSLTTDGGGTAYVLGEYVVVEGNDQPTFATAATSTTAVTLNEALKLDVVDDAVIHHFNSMTVNGAEAAEHSESIQIDGHTANKNLKKGQIISFGTGVNRHTYTIIEAINTSTTETEILLDRPLEAALSDNDAAFPGPAGSMNPVFHPNALTFVSANMRPVDPGTGATSAVAVLDDVGLRVTRQYSITSGSTQYNIDILAGIAVLDEDLMCVLLA